MFLIILYVWTSANYQPEIKFKETFAGKYFLNIWSTKILSCFENVFRRSGRQLDLQLFLVSVGLNLSAFWKLNFSQWPFFGVACVVVACTEGVKINE